MTTSNSSIASKHNMIVKKGDTFYRQFVFWQDEAKTIPVVITGNDFNMHITGTNDAGIVLSFAIGAGIVITAPNILTLSKTAAQMVLPAGQYQYDIQETSADSSVLTIIKGSFTIEADITQ